MASNHAIRALIIKGPTLHHHGLRAPRESTDVDVLVEPPRVEQLAHALLQVGWTPRRSRHPRQADAPHSLTFVHPQWPCDIDLHAFFPGILATPTEAFELLWQSHEQLAIANVACDIPDATASSVILIANRERTRSTTADIPSRPESSGMSSGVRDLADALGAVLVTRALGHERRMTVDELLAAGSGNHGQRLAAAALAEAPWPVKLRIVRSLSTPQAMRRWVRGVSHRRRQR
nr:nucleotidyltransferase family protein [Microbacterium thalassium]